MMFIIIIMIIIIQQTCTKKRPGSFLVPPSGASASRVRRARSPFFLSHGQSVTSALSVCACVSSITNDQSLHGRRDGR